MRNFLLKSASSLLTIGFIVTCLLIFQHQYDKVNNRLNKVEMACTALYTGGGVTQCANPTTFDIALRACLLRPSAYIGGTLEDTFKLIAQCVDDYEESKGWR